MGNIGKRYSHLALYYTLSITISIGAPALHYLQ